MIEVEEILDKLDTYDKIRCLNFCEFEFGDGGMYGLNNIDEIKEVLLIDFECTAEEIIDMFYKNNEFKQHESIFYTTGRGIETLTENKLNDYSTEILDNLCNGELREIIEDIIGDKINY